jgi:sulfur relay (sulfurtransferase) DsrC/TusE family protein
MTKKIEIRDKAWDIVDYSRDLFEKFKISVFWIIWYIPWKNDEEVVKFLNLYRKHLNNLSNLEPVNNQDHKKEIGKVA